MNNPKSPGPPSLPTNANTTAEKKTIVEEGTDLKGSITSTCPILVQGTIDGEVAGPSIDISPTGSVAGKITTGTLNSRGRIAGEADVDSARLSGTVAHNTVIRATKLEVKLASSDKKLELRFGSGGRGLS